MVLLAALWSGAACSAATASAGAGVIRYTGTGFAPMGAVVRTGTPLRIVNASDRVLDLVRVSPRGRVLGTLRVPVHRGAALRPTRLGVEVLYDATTTAFGGLRIGGLAVDQPRAQRRSPEFPIPAYAVIAVTGKNGGGVPVSGTGAIGVSASSMTFRPWILVAQTGTAIEFVNHDGMLHAVAPAPYPVLHDEHGRIFERRGRFQRFYLYPGGGKEFLTLSAPGLYHCFCPLHATPAAHTFVPCGSYGRQGLWVVDPGHLRGRLCRGYAGFPYVMDGWILVVPRAS